MPRRPSVSSYENVIAPLSARCARRTNDTVESNSGSPSAITFCPTGSGPVKMPRTSLSVLAVKASSPSPFTSKLPKDLNGPDESMSASVAGSGPS